MLDSYETQTQYVGSNNNLRKWYNSMELHVSVVLDSVRQWTRCPS